MKLVCSSWATLSKCELMSTAGLLAELEVLVSWAESRTTTFIRSEQNEDMMAVDVMMDIQGLQEY